MLRNLVFLSAMISLAIATYVAFRGAIAHGLRRRRRP